MTLFVIPLYISCAYSAFVRWPTGATNINASSENIYASTIENIYACSENIYASTIENMYASTIVNIYASSENIYACTIENIYACSENIYASTMENIYASSENNKASSEFFIQVHIWKHLCMLVKHICESSGLYQVM